jgi:hypothetical protein
MNNTVETWSYLVPAAFLTALLAELIHNDAASNAWPTKVMTSGDAWRNNGAEALMRDTVAEMTSFMFTELSVGIAIFTKLSRASAASTFVGKLASKGRLFVAALITAIAALAVWSTNAAAGSEGFALVSWLRAFTKMLAVDWILVASKPRGADVTACERNSSQVFVLNLIPLYSP